MALTQVQLESGLASRMTRLAMWELYVAWVVDQMTSKGSKQKRLLCVGRCSDTVFFFLLTMDKDFVKKREAGDITRISKVRDIKKMEYKKASAGKTEVVIRSREEGEPPIHFYVLNDLRNRPAGNGAEVLKDIFNKVVPAAGGTFEAVELHDTAVLLNSKKDLQKGELYKDPREKNRIWRDERDAQPRLAPKLPAPLPPAQPTYTQPAVAPAGIPSSLPLTATAAQPLAPLEPTSPNFRAAPAYVAPTPTSPVSFASPASATTVPASAFSPQAYSQGRDNQSIVVTVEVV
eukprot:Rhum_TRINITY_DN2704_c0_g1::Rhum_TRINITY_DN2704_c0_g1_i1::g.8045::m.8045